MGVQAPGAQLMVPAALVFWAYCSALNPVALVVVPTDDCERLRGPVGVTLREMDAGATDSGCYDLEAIPLPDLDLCGPW